VARAVQELAMANLGSTADRAVRLRASRHRCRSARVCVSDLLDSVHRLRVERQPCNVPADDGHGIRKLAMANFKVHSATPSPMRLPSRPAVRDNADELNLSRMRSIDDRPRFLKVGYGQLRFDAGASSSSARRSCPTCPVRAPENLLSLTIIISGW
jgi:hypothetical protein